MYLEDGNNDACCVQTLLAAKDESWLHREHNSDDANRRHSKHHPGAHNNHCGDADELIVSTVSVHTDTFGSFEGAKRVSDVYFCSVPIDKNPCRHAVVDL